MCSFIGLVLSDRASVAAILAQIGGPPHAEVIPYIIVVLCLALGLIVVCRSANRSSEVRLDDLDEE